MYLNNTLSFIPPTDTDSRRERIPINSRQRYEINKWLEANYERIKHMTRQNITALAVSELGYAISESTINTGISDTGLVIRPQTPSTGNLTKHQVNVMRKIALLDHLAVLSTVYDIDMPDVLVEWRRDLR